jgi:hypothetical protein
MYVMPSSRVHALTTRARVVAGRALRPVLALWHTVLSLRTNPGDTRPIPVPTPDNRDHTTQDTDGEDGDRA